MTQKHRWIWLFSTISTSIILAGCTSLSVPSVPHISYQKKSWQQRRKNLAQVRRWDIDGAFSIQQANRSAIASYDWKQRGDTYNIRIHASLNIYTADIAGKRGYVTLQQSNKKRYSARTPEQLMQKQLGWHLPISNLFYWMRGLPAPGKYQAKFDAFGHLVYLQQAGWCVKFSKYLPVGKVDLPRTLELQSKQLAVKIVIKHWKL